MLHFPLTARADLLDRPHSHVARPAVRVLRVLALAAAFGAMFGAAPLADWMAAGEEGSPRAMLQPASAAWLHAMNATRLTLPYAALRQAALALQARTQP